MREGNYYYIDKTLLIEDIEESGKVVLVPRPRRFGKTLNLSMLRYFYELSETRTDSLFSDTKIWQFPEFRALQGTFPVIFVSFREITQDSFPKMMKKFAYVIAREFKRHKALLEGDALDPDEKEVFQALSVRQGSEVDLGSSLEFLVRMLHKYHKKKVIVLLDEYDVPVQTAWISGFYDKLIPFHRELLTGALKDQELLERGVVTGNLTLAKAGLFTGLNNVNVFNLTRARMSDKFGFTSEEMDDLLRYYDLQDKQQDIKEWYNGYSFGTTQHIFNPWSALKCIDSNGELDPYWANTSDNILLKNLLGSASESIKIDLESLLQSTPVSHSIEESIVFPDLTTDDDLIWSLLLFSGYLTFTHYEVINDVKKWYLKIPNKEIQKLLTKLFTEMFSKSAVSGKAQTLLRSFVEGNIEIFAPLFQNFVLTSMGTFDITSDEPEKSYHLFVLGMLVMLKESYDVKSNGESGLGRYDIMLIPKKREKPGIIVEFKKVWPQSKETLESASQKALDQILKKNYKLELENQGIRTIIAYGIAFEKRSVLVKCLRFEQGKEVACQE